MKYLRIISVLAVLVAVLGVLAFQSGCTLGTDAATRLAYDLKSGAKALVESEKNELEVEHRPLRFPEGVSGDYSIWLQAVQSDNPASGSLAVGEVGGKRYGTSYHLNFMTVPEELRIRKEQGESTYLLLRKTDSHNDKNLRGRKAIEVISIR